MAAAPVPQSLMEHAQAQGRGPAPSGVCCVVMVGEAPINAGDTRGAGFHAIRIWLGRDAALADVRCPGGTVSVRSGKPYSP
ncbi:hypothetical protein SAMN05414137_13820 [Streptacidiphilus jiangxiensis]|uniref:Uncharacterized protein n=1 Tax=Streptacidiphilus jiangxiensis TaxID=235985 RepID=A0A1H7ZXC8_STRJI|nr:hypothetical protein SAMN05414137_13820 [Streptacidiphilus jiangxiensis]